MVNVLPELVRHSIRSSYQHSILRAEQAYIHSQEDEDAVTGALGQALFVPQEVITVDGVVYVWRTVYYKLRGRGKNAEEKIYGADGLIQIELKDNQEKILASKALLFQAKNRWKGKDKKLASQAALLARSPHTAIIINYSSDGYSACPAEIAYSAGGNRNYIESQEMRSLASVLGDDFLDCRVGLMGVHYNHETKKLTVPPYDPVRREYKHEITTTVIRNDVGFSTSNIAENALSLQS